MYVYFYISVMKMQERHSVLEKSIGFLDEEQKSLTMGYSLLLTTVTILMIGTAFQVLFFWMYNGTYHPFSNILKESSDSNKCELSFQSSF